MIELNVNLEKPFTIDQFYEYIKQKRLMGSKCNKCGYVTIPPRPLCRNCLSVDLSWTNLSTHGRLVTFTVIYLAPQQFASWVPYVYGIVELENGLRLPGIIRDVNHEKLQVGIELDVDFETEISDEWPRWPRYYFRPSQIVKKV